MQRYLFLIIYKLKNILYLHILTTSDNSKRVPVLLILPILSWGGVYGLVARLFLAWTYVHLMIVYRWKIMYWIFVCGLERCDTSSISMKASGYRDDILSFHPSDTCFYAELSLTCRLRIVSSLFYRVIRAVSSRNPIPFKRSFSTICVIDVVVRNL